MKTISDSMKDRGDEEKEDCSGGAEHPLFVDGLPSDFCSNPHLAALASLLEDDDRATEKAEKSPMVVDGSAGYPQTGGGKSRPGKGRIRRRSIVSPYLPTSKSKLSIPTVKQTELFLKLWKL